MDVRQHLNTSGEIRDIVIADLVLTAAFALTLVGGISNIKNAYAAFLYLVPITFVAVTLSFVLHELMHKFVAQHFGAIAAFKASETGLMITIVTSMLGFLVGIPGATVIYTNNFTKKEEGYVSLAGPLTNFVVFAVLFSIGYALFPHFAQNVVSVLNGNLSSFSYLQNMLNFALFISLFLAFFNMLPVYPLDGSKVFRWHPAVFAVVMGTIFVLMYAFVGSELIVLMAIMLAVTLFVNLFYRGVGLF
jgi:Zn-dependent protease